MRESSYCEKSHESREDILRWLAPYLASRISDNIPGERDKIAPLLHELLSSK